MNVLKTGAGYSGQNFGTAASGLKFITRMGRKTESGLTTRAINQAIEETSVSKLIELAHNAEKSGRIIDITENGCYFFENAKGDARIFLYLEDAIKALRNKARN